MDYQYTARRIIALLGGDANINSVFHCITRLRFSLKDNDKPDREALMQLDGVMGVNLSGDQFQVIIGNKVTQVLRAIQDEIPRLVAEDKMDEKVEEKRRNPVSLAFEVISGIFSPIIPAIAGAGILKGVLSLFVTFGWVTAANQTYQIMTAISDGVFYFMPMVLAFSAGLKFGANPYLSVALAAILFHPTLTTLLKSGDPVAFAGLTVSPVSYANSVIPILFSIWLLSYVERFFNRVIPASIRMMFSPLLSLMIVAPVMLIFIGPAGIFIGNSLSGGIIWLVENMGPLAGIVVGGTLSLMIITGMHYVLVPIMINNITRLGFDPIKPLMFVANFGQAGAAFGVFLRSRNKKTRTLALSTSFSALMGVSEPAMYGINIRFKKPFAAALIGGAAGGCLAMTMGVKAYAYALSGLSGLPALAGEGFGWALASIALAFAVAALVTVVLGFEEAAEVQPATATETDIVAAQSKDLQAGISRVNVAAGEQLYAPAEGKLIPLSEVSDPVFADEVFGKGIAIVPVNGQLVSPLNGRVGSVFATNHAITLESESGAEILIHIGIDTVKLNGKGFTRHVDDEQLVRVGEPLISFDLDALQADNIDPSIIIIVTNTERYNDISLISQTKVEPREAFLKLTAAAV
ncbi:beta-glucoside-specific PTS transporter subunit IIABC [Citrobacter freundii]|uniref:beta-glucoside-specific PTS transporter subunit IIABC n=1 Tax=Enterobacteriaceae TaxID=543 RepID=UPI0019023C29|nr:beta-glucoside-specific PTS transporter subunit IIABC [Citrobacter freundii]ELR9638345.1 PTS glucose transporter subunit IIA [Citrobacter farmeri]HBR1661719.1 PTS glucose transporter subunit IIA [Klebsiella pneumoniae]ELR6029850.1 PTS glucose transporter subunit IIA [Citrobacter freundii]MBJ9155808.1 PTS glucose transporter subunit IIA [Citrobacter freundii]MCO5618596.1 beta-glucoside-specific PTS transporter subunit IIABC [Citrobacter freundii]